MGVQVPQQQARPVRPISSQPLWIRVDQNRVKLTTFVVLFVAGSAILLTAALVAVPGTLIGGAVAFLELADAAAYWRGFAVTLAASLATLLALGTLAAAVQLANAEDWVRNRFSATDAASDLPPGLASALEDMSIAAGLPAVPRLLLLEVESVNACAIGTQRGAPVVGVTRGFLTGLSAEEQRAVIATLVARIVAGDILFGTALAALMGPLKAIRDAKNGEGPVTDACAWGAEGCVSDGCSDQGCGCLVDAATDSDSAQGCLGAIGAVVFAAVVLALTWVAVTVAAWVVTAWGRALHRTTYEKADAEGMLLLKDPGPMLTALRKTIESSNEVADGDPSYDGIFYAATSGRPGIEARERRRYDRLREVLGTEGLAATEGV